MHFMFKRGKVEREKVELLLKNRILLNVLIRIQYVQKCGLN